MALIEKNTRRIEIDEHQGCHIQIRDDTHIEDSDTGEILHDTIKSHRFVILVNDDVLAEKEGLTVIADHFWTPEVREKQIAFEAAREAEISEALK